MPSPFGHHGITPVCEHCDGRIEGYDLDRRFCGITCSQAVSGVHVAFVTYLKWLIDTDQYWVDPVDVADAMLDFEGTEDPTRGRRWRGHRLAGLIRELA